MFVVYRSKSKCVLHDTSCMFWKYCKSQLNNKHVFNKSVLKVWFVCSTVTFWLSLGQNCGFGSDFSSCFVTLYYQYLPQVQLHPFFKHFGVLPLMNKTLRYMTPNLPSTKSHRPTILCSGSTTWRRLCGGSVDLAAAKCLGSLIPGCPNWLFHHIKAGDVEFSGADTRQLVNLRLANHAEPAGHQRQHKNISMCCWKKAPFSVSKSRLSGWRRISKSFTSPSIIFLCVLISPEATWVMPAL